MTAWICPDGVTGPLADAMARCAEAIGRRVAPRVSPPVMADPERDISMRQIPDGCHPRYVAPAYRMALRGWSPGDPRGVLLAGPTGSGKSCALGLLARRAVEASPRVSLVRTTPALLGAYGAHELVERARSARWLWLDDVGMEAATDHTRSVLLSVLEGRYMGGRPTLAATTLPLPALEARYAPTLQRRLRGMLYGGAYREAMTCDMWADRAGALARGGAS